MNKKRLLTLMGAKLKTAWSVYFNGTTSVINAGSEASIDNLPSAIITIEGWIKPSGLGENNAGRVFEKSTSLRMFMTTDAINVTFNYATTAAVINPVFVYDNNWHHYAITMDQTGDKKLRFYLDGILKSTSDAVVGDYVSDADATLYFGNNSTNERTFIGNFGWIRISNNIRYTSAFSPQSRLIYPTVDANTVRLFKLDEETGTTITDSSANAQNATLTDGVWQKK